MSDSLLSTKEYEEILRKRCGSKNIKYIDAALKPISENVEGFMGEHYNLKILCEIDGEQKFYNFFIKTKPTKNKGQKELVNQSNIYDLEIFLYNFLFREFQKYGFDTSFAPKCYYCVPGETLVLENMVLNGFYLQERGKLFSLEECKAGLKALALFHGAGFMYEEKKSVELGRKFCLLDEYPDMFQEKVYKSYFSESKEDNKNWCKASLDMFLELINCLPESDAYCSEFKNKLLEQPFARCFVEETKIKKFCGHGDLWSNNMLFKNREDATKYCTLIDYQVVRYFYPSYDILYFLYANTSSEFRQKNFENLLDFYYKSLENVLAEHGFYISEHFPKEDYEESIKLVNFEAMLQAYSVHSIIFLPKSIIDEHLTKKGSNFKDVLFNMRNQISIEAFKNDDAYQKIIKSDLYDLHNYLFNQAEILQ